MRAALLALLLVGCGSGAVSDPASAPAPITLSVSPASATAYPGLPTVFTFTSSSAAVLVSSDNQAVIPSISAAGSGFVIVPAAVASETVVTLTVQDASGKVMVPVTVKPIAVAPLTVQPAALNFLGPTSTSCAYGLSGDVIIYGGKPPYVISQPPSFTVSAQVLTANPSTVRVTAIGCAVGDTLAVIDSLGSTASVKLTNAVSTIPAAPISLFTLTPDKVTLQGCYDVAYVALAGGAGTYFAATGPGSIVNASVAGKIGMVSRAAADSAPSTVQVAFSDGNTAIPVTVTLGPGAQGKCPP